MFNSLDAIVNQFGVDGITTIVSLSYILTVIPLWFVFKKAGLESWKALIPIYNNYLLFKIAWDTKWFWIMLGLSILLNITTSAAATNLGFFLIFGATAACIITICLILVEIFFVLKLSKSFGHSTGFAVGLILLEIVFLFILAFDSKKYIGPEGIKNKATAKTKK